MTSWLGASDSREMSVLLFWLLIFATRHRIRRLLRHGIPSTNHAILFVNTLFFQLRAFRVVLKTRTFVDIVTWYRPINKQNGCRLPVWPTSTRVRRLTTPTRIQLVSFCWRCRMGLFVPCLLKSEAKRCSYSYLINLSRNRNINNNTNEHPAANSINNIVSIFIARDEKFEADPLASKRRLNRVMFLFRFFL